jgi:hypothetical protein
LLRSAPLASAWLSPLPQSQRALLLLLLLLAQSHRA